MIRLLCLFALTGLLAAGDAAWPNVATGARLWNTHPLDQVTFRAWDGPAKAVGAVRIVAPIGGLGTGQLVATQGGGVKGLTVSVKPPAGWPADSVTARFQTLADERVKAWQWGPGSYLPLLTDTAPSNPVVPIRVVARVPRTAKPGDATATLSVSLGGKTQAVPVRIQVGAFTVPKPGAWLYHLDIYQSPEAVARQYGHALWSDPHWTSIEQSLRLIGDYGNHVAWVPLAIISDFGPMTTETMMRFQRDGKGGWTADASRVDRYLELYAKHNGEPTSLCAFVWGGSRTDIWMASKYIMKLGREPDPAIEKVSFEVTGIDGTRIKVDQFSPDAKALYTCMFTALRASVTKRGWKQSCVNLGLAMDIMSDAGLRELPQGAVRQRPLGEARS